MLIARSKSGGNPLFTRARGVSPFFLGPMCSIAAPIRSAKTGAATIAEIRGSYLSNAPALSASSPHFLRLSSTQTLGSVRSYSSSDGGFFTWAVWTNCSPGRMAAIRIAASKAAIRLTNQFRTSALSIRHVESCRSHPSTLLQKRADCCLSAFSAAP